MTFFQGNGHYKGAFIFEDQLRPGISTNFNRLDLKLKIISKKLLLIFFCKISLKSLEWRVEYLARFFLDFTPIRPNNTFKLDFKNGW